MEGLLALSPAGSDGLLWEHFVPGIKNWFSFPYLKFINDGFLSIRLRERLKSILDNNDKKLDCLTVSKNTRRE